MLVFGVGTLSVAACSSGPKISKIYEDKTFRGPLEKLLIVGIHNDRNVRARFERLLANSIAEQGGRARAISSEIGTAVVLDEGLVKQVAEQVSADGVLVVSVKSSDSVLRVKEGRSDVKVGRREEQLADFFRYDYAEIKDPDEVTLERTVVLTSELYLRESGRKLWTIESTSFKRSAVEEVLNDEAGSIAARLDRDGLIP